MRHHTTETAPTTPSAIAWDKTAVAALAVAGFVVSYDALRQMATAAHVRPELTWLFPLIVDGFIAYGVRALIVLRHAPMAERAYVWALVSIATAASVGANMLHAIRLNQQAFRNGPSTETDHALGLRLGNTVVGALSAIAPLALAGAVHLYTLIARRSAATPAHPAQHSATAAPVSVGTADDRTKPAVVTRPNTPIAQAQYANPATAQPALDADGVRNPRHITGPERNAAPGPDGMPNDAQLRLAVVPAPKPKSNPDPVPRRRGRPAAADIDALATIGREAVAESGGKLTRDVVYTAIRARGLPIGGARLTKVMDILRTERTTASDTEAATGTARATG